jgi:hypothetical protein
MYKEECGGSSLQWGREKGLTMDGGQQNRCEEDWQKLQKTHKQTEK